MEDITFSLFKGYADTLPAEATLSEIIRMIRQDPTVKLHTLKHRYYASQGNAAAADKEKSSCPCFSVAVRFQGGKRMDFRRAGGHRPPGKGCPAGTAQADRC